MAINKNTKNICKGDFIMYGYELRCLARVTNIVIYDNLISVEILNRGLGTGTIFSVNQVPFVVKKEDIPESILEQFNPLSDFFPRFLNKKEIDEIVDRRKAKAASIIQRKMKYVLYNPYNGIIYKRLADKYNNLESTST